MKTKGNKIIGGALWLGVGAFIAKLLGAFYRVPLTNLLGAKGLGLYQMVFPVYSVLLDFSGGGVPSALSKLISTGNGESKEQRAYEYLKSSLKLLFTLGLVGSFFMFLVALPLSKLQGDSNAYLGYLFLSPAIVLVSLTSCFRGYFQGLMNMKHTATSQVLEQAVKLCLGLVLVRLFSFELKWSVGGATLAITVSELVAFIYVISVYSIRKKRLGLKFSFDKSKFSHLAKNTVKVAFPVTLVCVMIPLSQVIDSFLILNILGAYRSDATMLYGLLSGVVGTVIGVPVSVCHGIATVAIPVVSKESDLSARKRAGNKTLALTFLASSACAIFTVIFAPIIMRILFGSLSTTQRNTAISLLRISATNIVLLSVLQTANAVLIANGKLYSPVISLGIGVLVKTVVNICLLSIPELNIYGGAIAVIACYFTVCLINLIMIFAKKVKYASKTASNRQYAS